MANGHGRTPARIGVLEFTYADPAVNVSTEQRTVEHETIDDEIVVQSLGRKPDQITIDGTVGDYELDEIDNLTELGVLELRTQRWSGDIIVKSTSTDFMRAKTQDGQWLYNVTINAIEVDETTQPVQFTEVLSPAERVQRREAEREEELQEAQELLLDEDLDGDGEIG